MREYFHLAIHRRQERPAKISPPRDKWHVADGRVEPGLLPIPARPTARQDRPIHQPSRPARWYWAAAIVFFAAFYISCLGGLRIYPAFGDDASIYVVTALSLAHGTGYTQINYSLAPAAQLYPIGYPLLLSGIFKVIAFGRTSIFVARLVSVISALIWLDAGRRLLRRAMAPFFAACAALAMGLTPWAIKTSGQLKSDMVFSALLMSAMVIAIAAPLSDTNKRRLLRGLAIGILAAAAMLVRTIGFTLVIGLAMEMILRRRWWQLLGFALAGGLLISPWVLWCAVHHGGTFHSYVAENVITWRTPLANFWMLSAHTASSMGFPPFETAAWTAAAGRFHLAWAPIALGIALTALVIAGWASLFRRRHVVALVLAPYLAVVLLWWWEPSRFIVPVLPLLVFCAAEGARVVLSRLALPRRGFAFAIAALCIAGGLAVAADKERNVWRTGNIEGRSAAVEWAQMQQGLNWIKQSTPADAQIYTTFPSGVYLFTARHTLDLNNGSHIGAAWTPSYSADLSAKLRNTPAYPAVYVYASQERDNNITQFIADHPQQLELQWASKNGQLSIYKVASTTGTTPASAASTR